MATREPASPEQVHALRRMTPAQRYEASRQLYWTLRRHKRAFLQSLHPEWSKERLDREVRQSFLDAGT